MKNKLTILWLCNVRFSEKKNATTGGWLQPMAEMLVNTGKISVVNVALGGDSILKESVCGIDQYVIPKPSVSAAGMIPSKDFCRTLSEIESEVSPDLVHIWGTEGLWGGAYLQDAIKSKAFVDIQGILSSSYYYYYGGMSFGDILKSIHLKEVLMPWRSLFFKRRIFKKRGKTEIEFLKKCEYISYQSDWVRRHISFINPQAIFLPTKIMLRKGFYSAHPWVFKSNNKSPVVFTSASGAIPYKGIQILFKSIALLKEKYPEIQLRVAGNMSIGNRLQDGFSIYVHDLVMELGLTRNVIFLGSINEDQIIKELQNANVCVIPSFIETYCLAFAESMIIGTPTIASFAGAMPELAEKGKESLFYNPLDFQTCASYIDKLVNDKELAEKLSHNGRKRRLVENDPEEVLKTQISIYNQILKNSNDLK